MTDMSNRKAELLANPIHHIDITEFDGRELIDSWEKMSFTSRDAARAARILQSAVADPDCSVILTLAGSTSAGGCMHVWRDMVRHNMVDAIVSTGASIVDMDFFEALGFRHYQAKEIPDDRELREAAQPKLRDIRRAAELLRDEHHHRPPRRVGKDLADESGGLSERAPRARARRERCRRRSAGE